MSWAAEDGAALYKKCAGCHGPDAAGKPAVKAPPSRARTKRRSKGSLAKAPHTALAKSLNDEQVKGIATYLKGLK